MKNTLPTQPKLTVNFLAEKAFAAAILLLILLSAAPAMAQELATQLGRASGAHQEPAVDNPLEEAQAGSEKAVTGTCGGMSPGNCQGLPTDIYGAWIRFANGQASFFARPQLLSDMNELGCTVTMLKTPASNPEAADRWIDMLLYAETFGVKVRISYGPEASNPQTCYIKHIYLFHS